MEALEVLVVAELGAVVEEFNNISEVLKRDITSDKIGRLIQRHLKILMALNKLIQDLPELAKSTHLLNFPYILST